MEPLRPTDPGQLGPYRAVARLGAGGMGEVFLARDDLHRTVAVKVVRPELAGNKAFRIRFAREVAAARAVSGRYTAAVVDADPDGPVPWLATEYIVGPTLADAVKEYGPLPPKATLALGAGLAESLIAVHSAGLVHRDLKPSNVLLSAEGPRVIDFGIVRATDGYELTRSGVLLGSPRYMCPEHAMGDPMGPEGDIFCLGSVLAFAATGNAPFSGSSAAALLYQVVHGTPDLTGVPDSLEKITRLCLDKTPTARPSPDRVSAACAPGGADTLHWDGWLPEAVTSSISRQAAMLMDLELGIKPQPQPQPDAVDREPAHSAKGLALSGGVCTDPQLNAQQLVTEPPSPDRVVSPEAPTAEPAPVPAPEPAPASGNHRLPRSRPSRRTVLTAAVLGTAAVSAGVAALLSGAEKQQSAAPQPAGDAPEPLWTYESGPLLQAPAVFYKDSALLKTQAGALVSLGLSDGTRPRWTYRGISQSPTPPLLVSDAVVALGPGATVLGVDPATGDERFALEFRDEFRFDTLLGKSTDNNVTILGVRFNREDEESATTNVVLGTDLRARRARVIAIRPGDVGLDLKPVIRPDRFIYVDGLHRLMARAADRSGRILWQHPMGSEADSRPSPVLLDGTVFAADGELVAVDMESGELRWRLKEERGGFASVAAADGTVYCTTRDPHGVQAFDAADGSRRWFRETPKLDLESAPVTGAGTVFVPAASTKNGFYAIDAQKGELLWNFTDGQETGINNWQLSCGDSGPLIAQHFDKVYALPVPR